MAAKRRRSCRASGGRRASGERGAVLVEFALVAIPLFTILFGTIEFGWAFYQLNDVRHGAREAIRLVAVNSDVEPVNTEWSTAGERIAQAGCERMDQHDNVTITIQLIDSDANDEYDVGDDAILTATKPLDQLTGMFDAALSGVTLEEQITSRLEQSPDWTEKLTTWLCR